MSQAYQKEIVNTLYHSAIITGITLLYSIVGKKLLRLDVGDPAKPDLFDFGKLTVVMTLSVATKEWLVNSKILPSDIMASK